MAELHSVEAAQALAVTLVRTLGPERVMLDRALGRVLAQAMVAPFDLPPDDNSAMDGFALRSSDVATVPAELEILGEVAAGQIAPVGLDAGRCYRIMTGATIPLGADAVVMVEHTEIAGDRVRVLKAARSGDHIRLRGSDVARGQAVLEPGTTIGPAEIGLLAALKCASVQVTRRPQVAILSTGDELCAIDEPLRPGKISDSNSYALAALVEQAGGQPQLFPIVRDRPEAVRAAMQQAMRADLIVSSGGVSVGEHDYVKQVLEQLGKIHLWKVAMKPGKPLVLASLGDTPYFGLPGNPASSMVSFFLFVRPAIRRALGCKQPFDLLNVQAILDQPLKLQNARRHYLRAELQWRDGVPYARPLANQGSGALSSMLGANALLVLEPGIHDLPAGAAVKAVGWILA